jgi:hypothetical protein
MFGRNLRKDLRSAQCSRDFWYQRAHELEARYYDSLRKVTRERNSWRSAWMAQAQTAVNLCAERERVEQLRGQALEALSIEQRSNKALIAGRNVLLRNRNAWQANAESRGRRILELERKLAAAEKGRTASAGPPRRIAGSCIYCSHSGPLAVVYSVSAWSRMGICQDCFDVLERDFLSNIDREYER